MGRSPALPDETSRGSLEQNYLFALRAHLALLDRLRALQRDPIAAFMRHVTATVPYYRGRRRTTLRGLPPVSRAIMREARARFLSSRFPEEAERFIARTNGTLSPSLAVSFDSAAFYDFNYFSLYRIVTARAGLADALSRDRVGIVLVSDDPDQLRYTVRMPLLDDCLVRRLALGRGAEHDRAIVGYLRARRVPILHGKPHTLRTLAHLDRALPGAPLQPRGIISAGERLYASERARLAAAYGVEPIDAYTASEGGLIALGCARGPALHVLGDRLHLEVLRGDGTLRASGRGELVLTNPINWAHAFVRYRMNDEVVLAPRCPCGHGGPTLVDLPGRDAAWFDVPRAGRVTSEALAAVLDRPEVIQFEVRQAADGRLAIRWIPDAGVRAPAVARRLADGIRALVGGAATLTRTDGITAFGGKQRRFIPAVRPPSA